MMKRLSSRQSAGDATASLSKCRRWRNNGLCDGCLTENVRETQTVDEWLWYVSCNALYWFLTGVINRICEAKLMKVNTINGKPHTDIHRGGKLVLRIYLLSFQMRGMDHRVSRQSGSNLSWESATEECDFSVKLGSWQGEILWRKSQVWGGSGGEAWGSERELSDTHSGLSLVFRAHAHHLPSNWGWREGALSKWDVHIHVTWKCSVNYFHSGLHTSGKKKYIWGIFMYCLIN